MGKIQTRRSHTSDFENLDSESAENGELKDFPFNNPEVSMLKSAQTETQLMDSTIYEKVDAASGEMVISHKTLYTYNSSEKKTSYITYSWDTSTSEWIGFYKTESTYDSSGKWTLEIQYDWDTNSSKWFGSRKTEYTYDSNGKQTLEIHYNWDTNASKWVGSSKYESTYDSNGKPTLQISYSWDINTSKWNGSTKTEYTYDSYGNYILYARYAWDAINNKWVGELKFEYAYKNGNPYIFDYVKYYKWNIYSDSWELSSQYTYYYSSHDVTGTLNVLNVDMKIYPNPVTNGFHISGVGGESTITLSDMNGKVMLMKEVANDEYVSTDALPQGIYLVRINTGKVNIVKKLVKR